MNLILSLWKPGNRTFVLSAVFLVLALIYQADSQGVFTLAPMLRMIDIFALTILAPLIPVYIRKGVKASTGLDLEEKK